MDERDLEGGAVIEFRFPGGRWEQSPIQDVTTALMALGENYDLRIDGEVFLSGVSQR